MAMRFVARRGSGSDDEDGELVTEGALAANPFSGTRLDRKYSPALGRRAGQASEVVGVAGAAPAVVFRPGFRPDKALDAAGAGDGHRGRSASHLDPSHLDPSRSSVYEADVDANPSPDSSLVDDPFGIGDGAAVISASGTTRLSARSPITKRQQAKDATLALLSAKLDMGLITDAEYTHMASMHFAANTLSPSAKGPESSAPSNTPPSTQYLDTEAEPIACRMGGMGALSRAEQKIFNMTEEERLQIGSAVRDGVMNMDQVMDSMSETARPLLVGHADIQHAAKVSASGDLPAWLDARMLRDELLTVLDSEAGASAELTDARARTVQLERTVAALSAEVSTVKLAATAVQAELQSASARAEAAEATSTTAEAAHASSAQRLAQMEGVLDDRNQTLTKLHAEHTTDQFHLESMRLRNKDLQANLERAEQEVRSGRAEIDAMASVKAALVKSGVDLATLTATGQEDKVREAMARVMGSTAVRTFDDALVDSEVTAVIEDALAQLTADEPPLEVLVHLIESPQLRAFGHRLSEEDVFGEQMRELARAGTVDRALDRFCSLTKTPEGAKFAEHVLRVLGSPTPGGDIKELVKGKELQHSVIQMAERGSFGSTVQALGQSGYLRAGIEQVKHLDLAGDTVGLLEQLETLSSSGSLAMVQQFAGPESPIGVAVDRLAQFVGDRDTIAKLKGFLEQGKSILQKGDAVGAESVIKVLQAVMPQLQEAMPPRMVKALDGLGSLDALPDRLEDLSELDMEAMVLKLSTELDCAGVPDVVRTKIVDAIRAGRARTAVEGAADGAPSTPSDDANREPMGHSMGCEENTVDGDDDDDANSSGEDVGTAEYWVD